MLLFTAIVILILLVALILLVIWSLASAVGVALATRWLHSA